MTSSAKLLLMALALMLPTTTFAQSADTQYCAALSAKYDRYVNSPDRGRNSVPDSPAIGGAKAKCASDPAAAIPVLERALKDAKLDLPPRGA
jgi:hypothetical protein